jgi:glucokinase-like ROK family protein
LTPLQPTHLRLANRAAILQYVRANGPLSRPQIADAIGLSRPTVAKLVDELVTEGLIHEIGLGQSTSSGGKRPGLVELNAGAAAVAAVALGEERIEVGMTDLAGHVLTRRVMPTLAEAGPADVIRRIVAALKETLSDFGRTSSVPVAGVGVGAPGVVHTATGVVGFSPNLPGWREIPLGEELARATGLSVTVETQYRAQTLGEVWFGHGQGVQNLIGLGTGVGIGAGVVLDGSVYRGPDDSAGEIGHTTIDPLGAQCHCGNLGCWEIYASTTALLRLVRDALWRGESSVLSGQLSGRLEDLTLEMVMDAAQSGDALARRYAIEEMGYRIGMGTANLVNVFNPELVVLFGAITALGEELLERIRTSVSSRALPEPGQRVRIVSSALGADAPLVGAATLVISRIFSLVRFGA